MSDRETILLYDHDSAEGSHRTLSRAIEHLTGVRPKHVDARHFLPGGHGALRIIDGTPRLTLPGDLTFTPDAILVYEIAPERRPHLAAFLSTLADHSRTADTCDGWRDATEKDRTIACFARDGVPFPDTIVLRTGDPIVAQRAFRQLGGDVWIRPAVGMGGRGVAHATTSAQVRDAAHGFAGRTWLVSRDAGNLTAHRARESLRVVVLDGAPLWAVHHLQPDPDAPTNESAGATSTHVPVDALPTATLAVAAAAVRSVGLRFGGVDLAPTDNLVFEVNVHPLLLPDRHLHPVAIPWAKAHLTPALSQTSLP